MTDMEWYEVKAEAFRICTRHMAPGKDPAAASYPAPFEDRAAAWDKWMTDNGMVVAAFRSAFNSIMGNDESAL